VEYSGLAKSRKNYFCTLLFVAYQKKKKKKGKRREKGTPHHKDFILPLDATFVRPPNKLELEYLLTGRVGRILLK
jgi:hypothetical protein